MVAKKVYTLHDFPFICYLVLNGAETEGGVWTKTGCDVAVECTETLFDACQKAWMNSAEARYDDIVRRVKRRMRRDNQASTRGN